MDHYLPFERPIERAIKAARRMAWRVREGNAGATQAYSEQLGSIDRLQQDILGRLSAWQRVQLARHPARPHGRQAAHILFGELAPLRGDRSNDNDPAIITGIGSWRGKPIGVIACERGQGKRERRARNFGMPGPQGFRKAARLLQFAERRAIPVVSLVDTPGAYPGVESERYCVAEAISRLLWTQAGVQTRTIGVVLGEGGSGGALALAMADRMLMMQHAYFSVISPEACASIIWRDGARTEQAAEMLKLLPEHLLAFGIVDDIVDEPAGGAHRSPAEAICLLREHIDRQLEDLMRLDMDYILEQRFQRYRNFGAFTNPAEDSH